MKQALGGFDARSTTLLTEARARLLDRPDYHRALVSLAGNGDAAVSGGATWLIKHELEAGWAMPPNLALALTAALEGITRWDAVLHVCQSAHLIGLPPQTLETWHEWLLPLLSHDRPFVRAWALDALCQLAALDSAFAADAGSALQALAHDPAASVRARVRNLSAKQTKRKT